MDDIRSEQVSFSDVDAVCFQPKIGNVLAGVAIGLLLVSAGGFLSWITVQRISERSSSLPILAERGDSWVILGVILAAGLGMILGAAALLRFSLRLLRLRIVLHKTGFRYQVGSSSVTNVPWNQVLGVKEIITYEKLPIVKGPARLLVPTVASKSYEVACLPKQRFHFDGNSVDDLKRFAELLREHVSARNIPWRVVEVRN